MTWCQTILVCLTIFSALTLNSYAGKCVWVFFCICEGGGGGLFIEFYQIYSFIHQGHCSTRALNPISYFKCKFEQTEITKSQTLLTYIEFKNCTILPEFQKKLLFNFYWIVTFFNSSGNKSLPPSIMFPWINVFQFEY